MDTPEFCAYIKKLRKEYMDNQTEFANSAPWHKNSVKGYEKDRLPDIDYLWFLASKTGHDLFDLLEKRLRAGIFAEEFSESVPIPFWDAQQSVSSDTFQQSDLKLTFQHIDDVSMQPTIAKGSSVGVDQTDRELREGKIYLIDLNGALTARRIQFGLDDDLVLTADNSTFAPLKVTAADKDKLKIVGRVCKVINEL